MPDEAAKLYAMMPRLLGAVLKENVEPEGYSRAQRQCRIAARKLQEQAAGADDRAAPPRQPTLFDRLDEGT